jgi:N-dimethylarginine dimethylaminohydrolase
MKLNSHNEWDKLKEVIVGSAKNSCAVMTWKNQGQVLTEDLIKKALSLSKKALPQTIIDETEEDLNDLSNILSKFGAKVYRPKVHKLEKFYSSPHWQTTGNNSYNARDLNLVVGDYLIESPSQHASRYFEATTYYNIFYENYFNDGFKWIAAPKPLLNYDVLEPMKVKEDTIEAKRYFDLTKGKKETFHKLSENEILFEAANTLRMGKDLLYLASSSGNIRGANWLQQVLPNDYKVHITSEIYRSSHIDSTVLCLRPGLVLLNSIRVNESNCPKIFEKWDKIWFSDVAPTSDAELDYQANTRSPISKELSELGFENNLRDISSPWVGMNVFSLDQNTVVVDERQKQLIKKLEEYKFNVVTARMRHMYTMGGGLHCSTLDLVRESKLESYFD